MFTTLCNLILLLDNPNIIATLIHVKDDFCEKRVCLTKSSINSLTINKNGEGDSIPTLTRILKCWFLTFGGKPDNTEQTLESRTWTSNKLDTIMAPSLGLEPDHNISRRVFLLVVSHKWTTNHDISLKKEPH